MISDLIKKWTGPLQRGTDRPKPWDLLGAEPSDIVLITRYVRAEDLVRRASVSKVMDREREVYRVDWESSWQAEIPWL